MTRPLLAILPLLAVALAAACDGGSDVVNPPG
jgi:hypothetical protein